MGRRAKVKKANRNLAVEVIEPELALAAKTSPAKLPPTAAVSIVPQGDGRVGKANIGLYRNWSIHSEWVRGGINIRRSQVSSADWDVVPFDPSKPFSKRLQKQIKDKLLAPNPRNDSFRSFIEPVVEDIIVLDAGVIEKERNLMGELVGLWPVDGASIRVDARWDGSSPGAPRYFWYPDQFERASFKNEDLVYMMANPLSWSPVGVSALETLKATIEAEMYGHEYNNRQVRGAAPDGIIDIGEDATAENVRRFESFFLSEVTGKGALGFIGGTKGAKFIPLRPMGNREMQFMEWQQYLVRKIAIVFGLTLQDLGWMGDSNKSTADVQMQFTEDRGLRPLMSLIQTYLTQEIVWDRAYGGTANNLAFRFTALNLRETKGRAETNQMALNKVPWKSINEARIEDGRAPWGDPTSPDNPYNKPIMAFPQGVATLDDIPNVRELIDLLHEKGSGGPGNPSGSRSGG